MHFKSTGLVGNGKWGKIIQKKISSISKLHFIANSKSKYLKKLDKIDWIFIATPDHTHFNVVNKCIKKKSKHFLWKTTYKNLYWVTKIISKS